MRLSAMPSRFRCECLATSLADIRAPTPLVFFFFQAEDGIRDDRKSTRLNSSLQIISYAVFCFKKTKARWANVAAFGVGAFIEIWEHGRPSQVNIHCLPAPRPLKRCTRCVRLSFLS